MPGLKRRCKGSGQVVVVTTTEYGRVASCQQCKVTMKVVVNSVQPVLGPDGEIDFYTGRVREHAALNDGDW